jgi:pro-sigmaK processing inhibitor BofA
MKWFWLMLLAVSSVALTVVLFRSPYSRRWLAYAAMNVVLSAFLLYAVNLLGAGADFRLPINIATVATGAFLGIPGILLLAALKAALL